MAPRTSIAIEYLEMLATSGKWLAIEAAQGAIAQQEKTRLNLPLHGADETAATGGDC